MLIVAFYLKVRNKFRHHFHRKFTYFKVSDFTGTNLLSQYFLTQIAVLAQYQLLQSRHIHNILKAIDVVINFKGFQTGNSLFRQLSNTVSC